MSEKLTFKGTIIIDGKEVPFHLEGLTPTRQELEEMDQETINQVPVEDRATKHHPTQVSIKISEYESRIAKLADRLFALEMQPQSKIEDDQVLQKTKKTKKTKKAKK